MRRADLMQYRLELWSPSRRANYRLANRRSTLHCRIDLTALVVILLVLLIIFMTGAPSMEHTETLELARVVHSSIVPIATRDEAMRVSLTRKGQIFFGAAKVDPSDLPDQIRDRLQGRVPSTLYLSVDAHAKYADLATVLDGIRLTKITNITFLTE
jgi:biopolymer transport protein ExbD